VTDRLNVASESIASSKKSQLEKPLRRTPRHTNIFGYFYDMDTGALIEVVRDIRRE
jgi:hypothetical protein